MNEMVHALLKFCGDLPLVGEFLVDKAEGQIIMWLVFCVGVPVIVLIDLVVLQRSTREQTLKESAIWVLFWVALGLGFNLLVHRFLGKTKALEFLTAYLIEESLSLDNMFVFIMIFSYFNIPSRYQRRILHWGIFMAIVMRVLFIFAGVALLERFHWMIYVFGAILVATGYKMAFDQEQKIDPEKNFLLRLCRKVMPFSETYQGYDFFVRQDGRMFATTAFATLLVIGASDLIFAIDSIPAVLAVSPDFFIVASSNVFAVLGLRALFFLISAIMGFFRFLKTGIAVILCFVGLKMIVSGFFHISIGVSLGVVGGVFLASILASVVFQPKK